MANTETEAWQDERLWNALKYRIDAAYKSRSRVRRQGHLEQALLYLNALSAAVESDTVPRNLLTAEDAELVIGAIPLQSGLLSPSDAEQLIEAREACRAALSLLENIGTGKWANTPAGDKLRAALNPSHSQEEKEK